MRSSDSRFSLYAALAANAAIAVTKFIAAAVSGSSAMLSEGIHSTIDTGDSLLVLAGVRLSRRAPDDEHPFGHGKDLYFGTLMVGVLIFAAGGGMSIFEGVTHLLRPRSLGHWKLNLGVIGLSAVFEGSSFFFAWRRFRAHRRQLPPGIGLFEAIHISKDPTAFVVLLEDGAALAGLAFAALGVTLAHALDAPGIDAAASIAIGAILAAVAVVLTIESHGLLIGESALGGVVRRIRERAATTPGLVAVNRVLTMQLGPDQVLVALDLALDPGTVGEPLRETARRLEDDIRREHSYVKHVYIDVHALRAAAPRTT
ncbi:MAG TPA: cation diffusion facilitator family transporter [Polyangia bacterium]|nr:cation diffusion facilitator family transporter [Polyangia bacterium]